MKKRDELAKRIAELDRRGEVMVCHLGDSRCVCSHPEIAERLDVTEACEQYPDAATPNRLEE